MRASATRSGPEALAELGKDPTGSTAAVASGLMHDVPGPSIGSWSDQWDRVRLGLDRVEAVSEGRPEPEGTAGASYDVFAFFINCYHLMDWIENDAELPRSVSRKARPYVRASNDLKTCADLANRSKHSALRKKVWTGDPSTGPSRKDVAIMMGQKTVVRHRFWVSSGGTERDALELAHACVAEWRTFLEWHNLA